MSNLIDEGIVRLKFDADRFNGAIRTSMQSIANLKNSLKSGFDGIAQHFSLASINSSIQEVSQKFSAFGVMGMTVLQNLTNSAVDAGKRMVEALTLDPVKMGYQEYETQINAIQTILSNTRDKGTTMSDVTKALDELNHYADMTIYNFTEMTRNIGTFTAAGIDLDTSVSAIKGIANLAAVSGSNSEQASRAMYQLSQALSLGSLKLQDWNSVVNAGMGGQVFQNALKETARAHGVAVDEIIEKQGSFRESLSTGWISKEILTETLAKFTGDLTKEQLLSMHYTEKQADEIIAMGNDANDAATKVKTFTQLMDTLNEAMQSGWTKTWELLIGNFEQARELLTSISDTFSKLIDESSSSRNDMLESWQKLGGRDGLVAGVKNLIQATANSIRNFRALMAKVIPPMTADKLYSLTKSFEALSERVLDACKPLEEVNKTIKKIDESKLGETFSAKKDDIFKKISEFTKDAPKTVSIIEEFKKLTESVFIVIRQGKANLEFFVKRLSELRTLQSLIAGLRNTVAATIKAVRMLVDAFGEVFSNGFNPDTVHNLVEWFRKLTESFVTSERGSGRLKNMFVQIFTAAKNVLKVIIPLFKAIFNAAVAILPVVVSAITSVISAVVGFLPQIVSLAGAIIPALISAFIRAIPIIAAFAVQAFRLAWKILPVLMNAFWAVLNAISRFWNGFQKLGGMTALGDIFYNVFATITKAIGIAKDAFETIFPAIKTAAQFVFKVVDSIRTLTSAILNSETAAGALEAVLSVIFGGFKIGEETISAISGTVMSLANTAMPALKEVFDSTFSSVTSENVAKVTERVGDLLDIFKATNGVRTEVFSDLLDIFSSGVKNVAAFVTNFAELGGFLSITQILRNVFDGIVKVIALLGESFKQVFGESLDAGLLVGVIDSIKNLTEEFLHSEDAAKSIKNIFTGLFSAIKLIAKAYGAVADIFKSINPAVEGLGSLVLSVLGRFGELVTKFTEFTEEAGIFTKISSAVSFAINTISGALSRIATFLKPAVEVVRNLVFGLFDSIVARVTERDSELSDFAKAWNGTVGAFANVFRIFGLAFQKLGGAVLGLFDGLGPVLLKLGALVGGAIEGLTTGLYDSIENISFNNITDLFNSGVFGALIIGLYNFIDNINDLLEGNVSGPVESTFKRIKSAIVGVQNAINADILKKLAVSIGILVASLLVLSLIDSDKLAACIATLTTAFGELIGSVYAMNKLGIGDFGGITKMGVLLIGISSAVLIMAVALKEMASTDWDGILKGLATMAAILFGLSKFLNNTNLYTTGVKIGLGLMLMAQGFSIMSSAVIKMGAVDATNLVNGLITMAALLVEIGLFVNATGDAKHVLSTGVAMIALGAALNIMAAALKSFGSLSLEEVGTGLLSMGMSLVFVVTALNLMPANVAGIAVGMVLIASAIKTLAKSLTIFGSLSLAELGIAMLGLAGSLTAIVLAMNLASGGLAGAIGIMIMATAIGMLAPALLLLGSMSLAQLGMSLLAIVGAFALMGAAGALLTPLVPTILGLGAALLLFGAGIALAGVGTSLLVAGLGALLVAVIGAADGILEVAKLLLDIVIALIQESAPALVSAVVQILILLVDAVIDLIPRIFNVVTALLDGVFMILENYGPRFIEIVGTLLTALLQMLEKQAPLWLDAGLKMLIGLLGAIRDNIQDVVAVAVDIVDNFVKGIANKLGDIVQSGIDLFISFINGIAEGIRTNTQPLLDACDNLIDAVIDGLSQGLFHGLNTVVDAAKNIGNAAVNGIKDLLGIASPSKVFSEIGGFCVEGLATAMEDPTMLDMVQNAVGGLADTATTALGDGLGGFPDILTNGVTGVDMSAIGTDLGKDLTAGLETGLDTTAMTNSIDSVIEAGSADINATPTVTPVVDASSITAGMKNVNKEVAKTTDEAIGDTKITAEKTTKETTKVSASMSKDVTDMIKSIKNRVGEINQNLTKLNESMKNMQIVMDSGALVGELASGVDVHMGQTGIMRSRGV